MLFLTHLVAAALVGRATRLSIPWLIVGAAVPDLVDKPLAMIGVVELFHSVGHTALVLPLVVPVALYSRAGLAAAVGWGSHLFLDAFHIVLNGRPGDALFLGWPVVLPPDPLKIPPGEFFTYYLWSLSFFVEIVIWAVFLLVVVRAIQSADSPFERKRRPEDDPEHTDG